MNTQTPNRPMTVTEMVDIVRRRKAWVLITVLLVMTGVSIYSFVATDRFKARALMSVEAPPGMLSSSLDPLERIQEQIRVVNEVLFSESVFKPVVEEFKLMNKAAPSPQRDLEDIRSQIKIEPLGEGAFYIGFQGTDRQQVADVSNRFAQLLSERTSARREKRSERETAVIDSEVERLRNQMANLDGRIQQYKQSAVEELPERADANLKVLDGLDTQLRETNNSISSEEAARGGALAEIAELEKQGPLVIETPAPRSATAERLETAKTELARLRARGYTRAMPQVSSLEEQITALQAQVDKEKPAAPTRVASQAQLRLTTLKAELETRDRRLASLRQQRTALIASLADSRQKVNSLPRHEFVLGQLNRDYDIAKTQYEAQLAKQTAARQAAQIEKLDNNMVFRIAEPAKAPLDPYAPNRLRLLLIGLGVALAVGLGLVFLVEQFDSSFKDVEELQGKTGLSVLTMVPSIKRLTRKKRKTLERDLAAQGISVRPVEGVVALVDPKSVPAEQYQILATRFRRMAKPTGGLVMMVTSSAGGEGKTLTSVNLAASLAASGAKVLLIDADLRRPRVHDYLGLHASHEQGLAALLQNPEGDLSKYMLKVGGLSILPGKSAVHNPLHLLASSRVPPVIERLRSQFQFIVIDSPPMLPLADGMVLGNLADRIVVVVRARQTTYAVLQRALESLDSAKVAGVILNDVDMKNSRYAYVYRYYENTYLRGA
jgi:succinoglycan biosynthesis transport protein ExoP